MQKRKVEARGKVFEAPMKSMIVPFGLGYKKRVYSPNRILYLLKRVDWNPDGARNPENRGKSGYVRISWDEATDIIAREIKRVIKKYGPADWDNAIPIIKEMNLSEHDTNDILGGNAARIFKL